MIGGCLMVAGFLRIIVIGVRGRFGDAVVFLVFTS